MQWLQSILPKSRRMTWAAPWTTESTRCTQSTASRRSAIQAEDPEECSAYLFAIRETACAIGTQLDHVHSRTLGGGAGIFDEPTTKEAANG
jgi:hypothetical protein